MDSIIWIAVIIAISSMLFGSIIFQFLTPITSQSMLEEKCEKIVAEGFQIHLSYPNFYPDDLPRADKNRLMYLDEIWIQDCVANLSAESIFNIIQKVENNFYSEE
jgi:hypothetical protein